MKLTLGEMILILRRRSGWTQPQLASKSGLGIDTVRRAENGELNIKVGTFQRIFDAFGCDISFRLGDKESDE